MRSFQENLAAYARLTVGQGIALQPGQEVLVYAEIGSAPLVRLIAAEAYKSGAKNVEIFWTDPDVSLARYEFGSEEALEYAPKWLIDACATAHRDNAARLAIISSDPSLLSVVPPEKVGKQTRAQGKARKVIGELVAGFHINWSLVGAASPRWAKRVFPELPEAEAVAKLWDAIFLTSRILEADPEAAWLEHSEALERRVELLNDLQLDALHFRGPGTDLQVGLVKNHMWAGGRGRAKNGILCSPNIPTEEVFCMPDRNRVEGVVSSTMPLSLRGQIIEGIKVEFKDGAAVSVTANKGEELLCQVTSSDEGANRLGEVALVPASSKVSKSGILFLNTLYDENAASHIAFGACYAENLRDYDDLSPEERLERGANDSIVHEDWMIGSAHIDVDGIGKDGSVIPLMRSGEWV